MIPQELDLVPSMTVAENIYSGQEMTLKAGIINKKGMKEHAQKLFDELEIAIKVSEKAAGLSVAQMQMTAIVKAIAFNAEVIIMDEPTSAITEREVEQLFRVISELRKQNKVIVYISHKMDEIYKIADRITIMRDGNYITTKTIHEISQGEVIRLMVGRELSNMYVKSAQRLASYDENEVMLQVENLSRDGDFSDISFSVKRGEILGISGLMGAGRTEVMETVFGLRRADSGDIYLKGKKATIKSPKMAIKNGLAFVSEDRKLYGLNLTGSIKNNISLAYLDKILTGGFFINSRKEKDIADSLIEQLKIKTNSGDTIVGNLSGGNQQKVILAKWLMGGPDIFIMDEPTRGIDVGAKAEIYKIMDMLAKQGKSIIMISSEMPELLGMSDRIIVMHDGKITGRFTREECSQEILMSCSVGGNTDEK